MKKCFFRSTLVVLFCLSGACASEPSTGLLAPEVRSALLALRESDGLAAEALVPDDKAGSIISMETIHPATRKDGFDWIRRVIKPQWLPSDIESTAVAMKGTPLIENRMLANGVWIGTWPTDYFFLQYTIKDVRISVLESGVGVCLRVDFLTKENGVVGGVESEIARRLQGFMNIPGSSSIWSEMQFSGSGALVRGATSRRIAAEPAGPLETRNWWDGLEVYIGNSFFFVRVPEIEPGPKILRSQAGSPRRF